MFECHLFSVAGTRHDTDTAERNRVVLIEVLGYGHILVGYDTLDCRHDELVVECDGERFESLFEVC